MNPSQQKPTAAPPGAHTELLILPDGKILVHNLTPASAAWLHELNPESDAIARRTGPRPSSPGSPPNS